jgi:hypothetical protein
MHGIVALVLVLAPPQPARAPLPDDSAATAIREGRYADAAEVFAKQYEQTGDPALLFGQAQALRRAGDCRAAIDVFERFIATLPPAPDIAAANDAIVECREIVGADAQTPEPEPQPAALDVPAPAPPRHWSKDPAGGVLVGLGGAIAVTGAAVFGASYGRVDDRPGSEAALEDHRRNVRAMWNAGLGLLVGGGVLMIAGAIRWGVVARANKAGRAPRVSAAGHGLTIRF